MIHPLERPAALGTQLRQLAENITMEATGIYELYGVGLKPKWFAVYEYLLLKGASGIMEIAAGTEQSHPAVIRTVKEMLAAGLVESGHDPADLRRTVIQLSASGVSMAPAMEEALGDVEIAIQGLARETRHNLWMSLAEWKGALAAVPLLTRVRQVRRSRLLGNTRIIPFEERHRRAFYDLNAQWIELYWKLEDADKEALEHPEHILQAGGKIYVAERDGEVLGVCALCRLNGAAYTHELAKLAVSPKAHGLGLGRLLCEAVIHGARQQGCRALFLESNTRLESAIALYRRLGFRPLTDARFHYERGNIQMELLLEDHPSTES